MKRLLIAEALPIAADLMAQQFSDEWDVHICEDNLKTIESLQQQMPDALIIRQQAYDPDARTILANCFPDLPPTILVITPTATTAELRTLSRWGVDCIVETPFSPRQLKQVLNILHNCKDITAKRVAQHLRVLGFSASGNGYIYLLTAIVMFKQDMTQQLHNDVYCKIGRDTCADERSVEKGIRTTIQNTWKKADQKVWAKYFPVDEEGKVSCPKNKEFITCLAQLV